LLGPREKNPEEKTERQLKVVGRWFTSLLDFLSKPGEMNRGEWATVANHMNTGLAQEYDENVAEMLKLDERFVLNSASKICKKVGFGKVDDFDIYVGACGNVKKFQVIQAVNDSYVDEILADPGDLIFAGDARLFVKKPDVSGDSRWEVYWEGRRITVKIVHYNWLNEVHVQGIEFGSKTYIDAKMKVYRIKSASGKTVEKFIVEEVFNGNYGR
jgi:hypothetical protein